MFADSLLETSWDHRARRGWMTLTSFGAQAVVVGVVLMISLLQSVGIPLARTISTPISMGRRDPGPTPQVVGRRTGGMRIIPYAGPFMQPTHIPVGIAKISDSPNSDPIVETFPYGEPNVGDGPGLPIPLSGSMPVMPVAPIAKKPTFRPSSLLEGMLIRRVQPVYPPLARSARIQGPVQLEATISREGKIEHLQLISGHPMLVAAAIDAVSQWRYRPYVLNGEAIEVETRITVNFILGGN